MNETDIEAEEEPTDGKEIIQEIQRKRSITGWASVTVAAIGIAFSLFQIVLAAKSFDWKIMLPVVGEVEVLSFQLLQANAIHVTFALVLAFILFPPSTADGRTARWLGSLHGRLSTRLGADSSLTSLLNRVRDGIHWAMVDPEKERITPLDLLFIGLSVLAGVYFLTDFSEIRRMRGLGLSGGRSVAEILPLFDPVGLPGMELSYAFVLGVIGVLLVLEATRRTIGLPLMLIVAAFIVYARWGHMIPRDAAYVGVLSIPELSWQSIIQNLWYNTENGVFGIPV
ncbi:MAG: TRAP transporter permease, partial [Halodesulfurarchaeum sp.]